MTDSAAPWSVSRKAGDLLIAAGMGRGSPGSDWLALAGVVTLALGASFLVFVWSARSRA
jgi:putative SOS response-associated peptidase YedK